MIRRYQRYRTGHRWLIALGLLVCVVSHTCVVARLLLSPEQFRARTQIFLQQHFAGRVALGEADYRFPTGMRLEGISVFRPADQGGGELVAAKALTVDLSLSSVLRGDVAVEELVLDEPVVSLTQADFAAGATPKGEPPEAPVNRVVIRGGRIHISEALLFKNSPALDLHDVNVELRDERRLANGFAFEGEANSALWGRCDLEGTIDLGGRRLDAAVVARAIAIDKRLRTLLPELYVRALDRYDIHGSVDLTIESSIAWGAKPDLALRAAADLRGCRAAWENFPVQCTDIRGKVVFDGANVYYQNITGRAGPASVAIWGQTTAEKIDTHLVGRGRPLDREIYDAAPANIKRLWDRLGVEAGIINVDHRSTWWRKDRRFEAAIRAEVRDAKGTYAKFPYALTDVTGTFRWEDGVSYIDGVRGRHGRTRVQISGQVTDPGAPDLLLRGFDMALDDDLRNALTPGWKRTFEELRPTGMASVECRVTSRDGDPDDLLYRLVIRPEGASFHHKSFPHRITDVRGDIVVDEAGTVSFRELYGRLRGIPVQFLGTVRPGPKGPVANITVVAPEVELGPDARAVLAPAAAEVYDDLSPRGKVSVTWRLVSDPAAGPPTHSTEIRCLQDCSVQHRLFPIRVTNLMERVIIDHTGRATFTGVKGRVGESAVEAIDGRFLPGPDGGLHLTLRGRSMAASPMVHDALPKAWQKVWDEIQPSGQADIEYHCTTSNRDKDAAAQRITIEPADAAFTYRGLPIPVCDVTRGKIVFDQNGNTTITNVQGKVHGKSVVLTGRVSPGPKGQVLDLEIAADELALNDELRGVLPETWQKVWDELQLGGRTAATARAVVDLEAKRWDSFVLNAGLRGCRATWRRLPIPLTGLRGQVEYRDGVVSLSRVVGECALGDSVVLSGRVSQAGTDADRLHITVQGARLGADLRDVLPPDLRKAVEAIDLQGAADVELTLKLPGPDKPTECSGLVRLHDCSFRYTDRFERLSGDVRLGNGRIGPDGAQHFEGSLDLRRLRFRNYAGTDIRGGFAFNRAPAAGGKEGEVRLLLTDLVASFYGGRLSASLEIGTAIAAPFRGWLAVRGADFKVLCEQALKIDKPASGTLDVRVEFPPGRYPDEKGLIGDGTASVTRGELGQLPLTAALFNTLGFRSPLERSITEAEMKFGIADTQLRVKQLSLLGESRLMTGQGTVGFDRSLSLRLVSPKSGIEIPIIQSFLREQLVQIDVRGTTDKPEYRMVPVPAIPQLVEEINALLGIWRKRQPKEAPSPKVPKEAPAPG